MLSNCKSSVATNIRREGCFCGYVNRVILIVPCLKEDLLS